MYLSIYVFIYLCFRVFVYIHIYLFMYLLIYLFIYSFIHMYVFIYLCILEHCIHQLLPPEKILPMKLRASNCIFALPRCHFNLYKRSFVLRSLFEDAY